MKQLFEKIDKLAWDEINKYGGPIPNHYAISLSAGERIARQLGVDEFAVKTGIALMDIKLGECNANKIQPQHTQKSYEYSEKILKELGVDAAKTKLLLNCVAAHHGKVPFESLEAEICANADCYRFLTAEGIYDFIMKTAERKMDHNSSIDAVIAKMDEKFNILSIQMCKDELSDGYHKIRAILESAKIK